MISFLKKRLEKNLYRTDFKVILAMLGGLAIAAVISFYSGRAIQGLLKSEQDIVQFSALTDHVGHLRSSYLSLEAGLENYIQSNIPENKERLKKDKQQVVEHLAFIKASYPTVGSDSLDELERMVNQKILITDEVLAGHRKNNTAKLWEEEANRDSLFLLMQNLESKQGELLFPPLEKQTERATRILLFDRVGFLLTFLIVGLAIWLYLSDIQKRENLAQQLRQALEETKSAAKMKEDFLANMSHDLRTPLNAVLGFSELLQKKGLPQKQAKLVEGIQASGKNLLSIINNILDYTKVEAGMMPLEKKPFSPSQLLHSVVNMFSPKIASKGLQMDLKMSGETPPTLLGDPYLLTRILVNLIGNAVKFTPAGSIHINAKCTALNKGGFLFCISVKDSGIGITEDQIGKIYDRFAQADPAITHTYGGSGLGLAIVKNLVEMQNGNISVKSKVGEGTEFYFAIPYALAASAEVHISKKTTGQIENNQRDIKGMLVLLVEDNPMNQQVMELFFQDLGIIHDLAPDGREALEMIKRKQYDLVFMDIQMPNMDGYTAARYMRDKLHIQTPIVAMTAHVNPSQREKCREAGMNDYLSKPFREKDLIALLKKYAPKKSTANNTPLMYDREYLNELTAGKPERLKKLTTIFSQQAPKELNMIKEALEKQDFQQIQKTAHSMKSTVGYMGLQKQMGEYLIQLKMEAETEQRLDVLQSHIDHLESLLNMALLQISALFEK